MPLPMQSPLQKVTAVPGTVAGRPKASGCPFRDFLLHFGNLLAPFGRLGRAFLDPGTTPGPFGARDAKSCKTITNWPNFGGPRGPQFETSLVLLMTF